MLRMIRVLRGIADGRGDTRIYRLEDKKSPSRSPLHSFRINYLLKASPADIRKVCVFVCPHAFTKFRTYEVIFANDA